MTDLCKRFGLDVDGAINQLLDYKNSPAEQVLSYVCLQNMKHSLLTVAGRLTNIVVILDLLVSETKRFR